MRFYLMLCAMFLCTAMLTWAIQHPIATHIPPTPGKPACTESHHQIVMVTVACGKAGICDVPLVAEVCDKLLLAAPPVK